MQHLWWWVLFVWNVINLENSTWKKDFPTNVATILGLLHCGWWCQSAAGPRSSSGAVTTFNSCVKTTCYCFPRSCPRSRPPSWGKYYPKTLPDSSQRTILPATEKFQPNFQLEMHKQGARWYCGAENLNLLLSPSQPHCSIDMRKWKVLQNEPLSRKDFLFGWVQSGPFGPKHGPMTDQ